MKTRWIVLALAMLATPIGCVEKTVDALPHEVIGVWTTEASKYEGRYFEFTNDSRISIGTGGEDAETYAITHIEKEVEARGVLYTVSYVDHDGETYRFPFYLDGSENAEIRLKNQQTIAWKKARR